MSDSFAERAAREYLNRKFAAIGTMTSLKIDSANHRITFDLDLKGESTPLSVIINRYELTTSAEGKTQLEIQELTTSREWLNALAVELLHGKKIEVPDLVKSVL